MSITEGATILFTDIVGSTELLQRLSPNSADEIRREHFSVLRQAIAEAGGTEVKNLGDGVMVVFSSTVAALSCAVAMQRGVERGNRKREHSVGLRVGLSAGEVSREDGDYFGEPVVVAARLCAACESGQILAADVVRLMAGRRSRYECRAVGEMTLKGLTEPVEAVVVLWESLDEVDTQSSVPFPVRLAVRPASAVVGRVNEMEKLAKAADRVASGGGREVIVVSGEAGLGKTTVVAESARAAFDAGACVLFGHCEEDLATPYQLFAEALSHWVTHAPESELRSYVNSHGSELSRLVPSLAARIPDLAPSRATDADTERFLLFAAVVGFFATLSERQPIVLVLDDLQWADKASLLLLRHLVASEVEMRLLVVGTYRNGELAYADALVETLAALRRQDRVSRIELAGIDDTDVVALMEAVAGHQLDGDVQRLAHAIYRETDGNPFFVGEVLRHLTDTGMIGQNAEGRWVAEGPLDGFSLPDSVREVIAARVRRLGKEAGNVLSVAAVIGRDFDLDVLARATATSDDDLLDLLDAAAAVALVRDVGDAGRYSFAHALIQHTLYEDLAPNRRARVHRQVAEALEELCGDRPGDRVGELARHWIAATQPIDLARAINYSRQAGDAALNALAPAEAMRYYAQALDLLPLASEIDPVVWLDLAVGLGTAQRQTGDPTYRATLLDAARRAAESLDTKRLVAAALANNRGWYSDVRSIDTERIEILELTLDRLPVDSSDRALILATLCAEVALGWSLERRIALADEALTAAYATGDDEIIVRVLNLTSFPLHVPSLLEQTLDRTKDALIRAQRLGDPFLIFWAAAMRIPPAFMAGDSDEVDHCHELTRSLSELLDQPFLRFVHAEFRATRMLISGDTDRAEELAREAFRLAADSGQADAFDFLAEQMAYASIQRGNLSQFEPYLRQNIIDLPNQAPVLTAWLARAHLEADRLDDAASLLDEFADSGFELRQDADWTVFMALYAETAVATRDADRAAVLFDRLAPFNEQWCSCGGSSYGPVSRHLGDLATVLGRYEDAETYFARASAFVERIGAKFDAACNSLSWGRMLIERGAPGSTDRSRELFAQAHAIATANGYRDVERRAAAELQMLDT